MTDSQYQPGVYVKDGLERVAETPASVVALVFEGYVPKEAALADTSYSDLQTQAKELGVPANQSKASLRAAVAKEALPSSATVVEPIDTQE